MPADLSAPTARHIAAVAHGTSMLPTLRDGDRLIIDTDPGFVREGDIVLIGEVTHRLRWIDPWGGYWEAGDGPYALPRRFRAKDISGKVVAIARGDEFVDVIPVGGSPRVVLGLRLLVWRNRQRVGVRPVARVIFGQSADV